MKNKNAKWLIIFVLSYLPYIYVLFTAARELRFETAVTAGDLMAELWYDAKPLFKDAFVLPAVIFYQIFFLACSILRLTGMSEQEIRDISGDLVKKCGIGLIPALILDAILAHIPYFL